MQGSTTARGYGTEHQIERRRWTSIIADAGELPCPRCGEPVYADDEWDLGHTEDRTGWTGPEHPACNRSAGAVNSNRGRQMTVRQWP